MEYLVLWNNVYDLMLRNKVYEYRVLDLEDEKVLEICHTTTCIYLTLLNSILNND